MPVISELTKIVAVSPKSCPTTSQPLYQRLPVSPHSQMVPMRQISPRAQNVTTTPSSPNVSTAPPLVPSRIPPLVTGQLSPRIPQPLSPNGQWIRNSVTSPMASCATKPTTPPARIPVSVPISCHRPESQLQHIYSTPASQQPVIQHAPGMRAVAPNYPRGGLPPLTVNIPPRPYLTPGSQPKSSREPNLPGKALIETLIPVNASEPSPRMEEPKLSPGIIPEPTNKASTSPKVPSPNQPPTYIPETAKIEIRPSTSSPVFGKTDVPSQFSVPVSTDSALLSPRQKQEPSNVQLLTAHVPRSSTPSPVIVAHGQSHLVHTSLVHPLLHPTVSSPNQSLIKTVVPIMPQQMSPTGSLGEKCLIQSVAPIVAQKAAIVPQAILLAKSHVPVVSTMAQSIITRVTTPTAPILSMVPSIPITPNTKSSTMESDMCYIPEQREIKNEPGSPGQVQSMQHIPPVKSVQPVEIKQQETPDIKPNLIKSENVVEHTKAELPTELKLEKSEPCPVENVVVKSEEEKPSEIIVAKSEPESPPKHEPVDDVKPDVEQAKHEEEIEQEADEEPTEDPLKEPCTDPLALDAVKEDATDSKEDSDYWSAKEVNIESVIKKVDALCDGEGNDVDEDDQIHEGNAESHETHESSKSDGDSWFDSESIEDDSKKNYANTDDQDEGVETGETESTRARRGRSKAKRAVGQRGGVTTRRGGRNAAVPTGPVPIVPSKRGGRAGRGGKQHAEKNKLPADVYEFHDDSEEDNAGRPRLILTIKSPGPTATGPNAQPATPVAAVKEVPPEEFVSPAVNTRKSRRLAEKDGSRSTVDDVIEDVVRGAANKNGQGAPITRRSTRQNSAPRTAALPVAQPLTAPVPETRKSPRSTRKAARRTSESTDEAGDEKINKEGGASLSSSESPAKDEAAVPVAQTPKVEEANKIATAATPVVAGAPQKPASLEPMTLIDPVTGMLIPMRESEEGQYIPVSTASGQVIQSTLRTSMEARTNLIPTSTQAEVIRPKPVETIASEAPKLEPKIEPTPCKPPQPTVVTSTASQQSQPSVIAKPQSPVVQANANAAVQPVSAAVTIPSTTATATVSVVSTAQAAPSTCSTTPAKPTSLKAHVLNASKLVNQVQHPIVVTKAAVPNIPSQTVVQNIVKQPAQVVQGLHLHVPAGRVVSPSLSPLPKPVQPQPAVINAVNGKQQGQPISPVLNNTGAPPNPKQHLLQAAKQQQLTQQVQQQAQPQPQQTPTIVNLQQKIPVNVHPVPITPTAAQRQILTAPQPTALKGINGQAHPLNPKAHLLQAVVPSIVAGTVASPPAQSHLVAPQPVVTGVPCTRTTAPKPSVTGGLEAPKVEVSMSGCIMVPVPSPQGRVVPISAYEASLHGSAGTTPSPGGQYGLVPPHRSQSPPLPPPAHHHANTAQGDVVNHYGGPLRAGEIPAHYMHPQVLQYQYLRAQQEALTAPRIPYHVPGTRSPHLPLEPKLEAGVEETHSPPLELRRGTRTPQERTTDSPQVAQVYMMHGANRLPPPPPPQYNTPGAVQRTYYEPPPAHLRSPYPMAATEAPIDRALTPDRSRKQLVATPPHASQLAPQADSLLMLLQRYPVMWQGLLALKNDQAAVQMHFVFGNPNVARESLPCNSDHSTSPLRIAQRMRLEPTQVEGVARKMQTDNEHCMLLALPCGRDHMDVVQQSKNLQTGFITYLQQKQAAGIVNIPVPGSQQPAFVVHIFPSCDFANESLARIAPDLLHRVAEIAHLLIVIATV